MKCLPYGWVFFQRPNVTIVKIKCDACLVNYKLDAFVEISTKQNQRNYFKLYVGWNGIKIFPSESCWLSGAPQQTFDFYILKKKICVQTAINRFDSKSRPFVYLYGLDWLYKNYACAKCQRSFLFSCCFFDPQP